MGLKTRTTRTSTPHLCDLAQTAIAQTRTVANGDALNLIGCAPMSQSIPVNEISTNAKQQATSVTREGVVWRKILLGTQSQSVAITLGNPGAQVLRQPAPPPVIRQPQTHTAQPIDAEAAAQLAAEVRRAQSGDADAMASLIENNRTWVRGIAYTVLGDAHLAEDAAQEVCVRVVKHLRGLDTPEAFRPWVYRMTRNVALSMAQRRERSPQPLSLDAEQLQENFHATRDERPGAALEETEKVSGILETIGRLPDIYREVLVLKHVQDLSYSEMSRILGVSVKSLEVRLVRARKLLQDRLGRRFNRGRRRDPIDDRD